MAVETTTFKYAVDQNSVNAVKRAAAELEGALNDGKTELAQYGTVSRQAMTRLESSIDAGTRALREHEDAIERVKRGYDDAAQSASRAASAGGGVGGIDTVDRIGSVGSQLASGLGQGELANVLGLVGDLAGGLGSLGGILAPLSLGIGALTLVYAEQQKEQERVRKEVEQYTDALTREREERQRIASLISGGDSGAVTQQLAQAMADYDLVLNTEYYPMLERQQTRFAELEAEARRVAAGTAGVPEDLIPQAEVDELALAYAGIDTQFQEIQTTLNSLSQETLTPLAVTIASLSASGKPGAAAIADLLEEQQRLQVAREAESMSYQDVRERIDTLNEDIDVLGRQATSSSEQIAEARQRGDFTLAAALTVFSAAAQAQQTELIRQRDLYEGVALQIGITNDKTAKAEDAEERLADKREKAAKAAEDAAKREEEATKLRTDAYLDALKRVNDATEARRKLEDEFAKAAAENAAKEKQIADDLAAKEQQLAIDYGNALAKIETDGGKERERIAKDYAKRRADLEQQAYDAMAARDQEAYKRVKKQQEETEQDEEDAQKELDKRLDEQRKALKDTYDKQVADAKDAAAKLLAQEQARWANERATRQAALNQAQVDLFNALNSQRLITQTFYADQATTQQQAYSNLISMAFTAGQSVVDAFDAGVQLALFQAGAGGGTGSGSVGGGMTGIQPSPFGAGDFVPRTGGFLPSASGASRTGAGTLVNQIYLNGVLTKQEAKSLVNDGFGEFQQTYLDMIGSAA